MKTKMIVLVEIAIVLCSVLVVALPTIAAEQTTQEMSASTITATSEDDFVLGIYGNANEDNTIDMRDLTYVKLIFFGKKPETDFADAKYDGKINPLDFIQIKLIIVGKEKEITVIDNDGDAIAIHKPIERIIPISTKAAEVLQTLNEEDKVVGVTTTIADDDIFYPKLSKLPTFGGWGTPDYEKMISLNPEFVIGYMRTKELKEKLPENIKVVRLDFVDPKTMGEEIEKLGYILDKEDEAEAYCDWYEGWLSKIKSRTEGLSEEGKPLIYVESTTAYSTYFLPFILVGGRNIAEGLEGYEVDPEWVIEQDPEIIVKVSWWGKKESGYEVDDPSEIAAMREEIMNRPELAEVEAVKNGKVYVIAAEIWGSPHYFVGAAYQAKWFHPELFEDLDPKAIHQEYLTRFQGLDYDLEKHGVFVYPEPR